LRGNVRALELGRDFREQTSRPAESGAQGAAHLFTLCHRQQPFEEIAVRMQPVHHPFAIRLAREKGLVCGKRASQQGFVEPDRTFFPGFAPSQRRLQLIASGASGPLALIRKRLLIWERDNRMQHALAHKIESQGERGFTSTFEKLRFIRRAPGC